MLSKSVTDLTDASFVLFGPRVRLNNFSYTFNTNGHTNGHSNSHTNGHILSCDLAGPVLRRAQLWLSPILLLRSPCVGNRGGSRVGSHEGEQGSWTPKPALHPALYVVLHKTRRFPTDTCGSRQKEGSGSDSPEKSMNLCLSDSCGWQFAIYSEGNGSELQKKEFNLDTVESFLMSQDIKLRNE